MKSKVSVLLAGALFVSLLVLVSGCAQKADNPADTQAIKKLADDYVKAMNALDADGAVAMMSDNMVYADINIPVPTSLAAVKKFHQDFLAPLKAFDLTMPITEVHVTGDLGVARGTWTAILTPKSELMPQTRDSGSWMAIIGRQSGGSWKWQSLVANSDQPAPGSTADGGDEAALLKIEQDWADALIKLDAVAYGRNIAKEWTLNSDGQVMTGPQIVAEIKSGAYKIASFQISDFSAHVFGDAAIVLTSVTMKGTYKGIELPSPQRSVDFFIKRDGQWWAVGTQNTSITK